MRILHTADWHVGKKLGRIDRSGEVEEVLDELVEVARDQKVDAVIVAGDLFDRALPPFLSLRLVLETLTRLADTGARVVAIPGNHDSSELFDVLAPHLEGSGVTLVHKCLEPGAGGVVRVPSRDGKTTAQIACMPFIHEIQVIELMGLPEEGFKKYAEKIRNVTSFYARSMMGSSDASTVDILAGHFMVHGAIPSGTERELHIGEAYMTTADAIPSEIDYAALGHIHLAQVAPGAAVPARYAGSLMQLDFGEAGQEKSVCIVDLHPARPARVERIEMIKGRRLLKVEDTLENLKRRIDEFGDAILSVGVLTEGPAPGLSDEVRGFLPNALYVRAVYERDESYASPREGLALDALYGEFVKREHGVEARPELLDAFRELASSVGVSW